MKSFEYTIKDELGIHARPAGMLVKAVKEHASVVSITKGDKTIQASKLIALMGLGIKCNDTITVSVEGEDEDSALEAMKQFFQNNL